MTIDSPAAATGALDQVTIDSPATATGALDQVTIDSPVFAAFATAPAHTTVRSIR